MPTWYPAFFESVAAHLSAGQAADGEWLLTHWLVGQEILHWQTQDGWVGRIIDHLSTDLRTRFPTHKGLSPRNLRQMRTFANAWPHQAYAQGPLAQLPWHHHLTLIQKLDTLNLRLWYAKQAVEEAWTHETLTTNITKNLHRRPRR
jgi:predicted nuclease of restriction endonuclease-like (RecB) superfamily